MRFLKFNDNGEPSLIERNSDDIPAYAILSHAWGADSEEVTFDDMKQGTGKDKPGYDKIRFCAQRSDRDGLRFFWIDTCCINKANFTELSEAINSMFKWYRESTRCYVYFSDVPDHKDPTSTIESAFPNSRWFRRGWTLQELIAPPLVEFFSRSGDPLGSKKSRVRQIHRITGIDIEALQGTPLSEFSTDKRISWTRGRETKLQEDAAYCLLGIFDIHMSLIYGEGRQRALDRLRRKVQKSSAPMPFGSDHTPWAAEHVQPTTSRSPNQHVLNLEDHRISLDTLSPPVKVLKFLGDDLYPIIDMAISRDNKMLALVSSKNTLELRSVQSDAVLKTCEGLSGSVSAVAFSPDGMLSAIGTEEVNITLCDAKFDRVLRKLKGHSGSIGAVVFSPDSRLLASSSLDRTIRLWYTRSGATIQVFTGLYNSFNAMVFSPDSKRLVTAHSWQGSIRVLDTLSGRNLHWIEGYGECECVLALAFSQDGNFLASTSTDMTIRLWNGQSGKALQTLTGHLESALAVAFLPDGKLLASVSRDGTVKLWDVQSAALMRTLGGPPDSISAVAFSPDRKLLALASSLGKTISLWHI